MRRFLRVPSSRKDCRHPPPPLPDQAISVVFPKGIDANHDPVWVREIWYCAKNETKLHQRAMLVKRFAPSLSRYPMYRMAGRACFNH
ncbi:DUF3299 domain-containing protein [Aliiruegeria haliotis]|uniref:DUF3299 domain-containing protein n=1 Tax=Aliiruegeria haliotis TaxID=1280846 RepID=UPI0011B291E4